jgi:DNA-binding beta-propeller fold protein YncE
VCACSLALWACGGQPENEVVSGRTNSVFAAVERDGTLAELDGSTGALIRTVDLSELAHDARMKFDVEDVQAAPDGRTVWLTAKPESGGAAGAAQMPEELVGVDASTGKVSHRIDLGTGLNVAHVVIRGSLAYVTAYGADLVLVVDLVTERVIRSFALPSGTGPEGARLTPDGVTLVVAGMGDGSMHTIHTGTGFVESHALPGRAMQSAVLPDGSAAFATVYDTRQVARLDLFDGTLSLFELPAGAAGPVQLYPASSTSLWIADQGMLDGDAAGNTLYRMSAAGSVDRTIVVSPAPHGVVVNSETGELWTTTLAEGTVEAVDGESGEVLWTTRVGDGPSGITCVNAGGAMP